VTARNQGQPRELIADVDPTSAIAAEAADALAQSKHAKSKDTDATATLDFEGVEKQPLRNLHRARVPRILDVT